jgi:hypothetical protein
MADDDDRRHPSTNHPLNGPRRPLVTPIVGVIGVVVLVAVIVLVLTLVRYHT